MAKKGPSKEVLAARNRRPGRAVKDAVRVESFIKDTMGKINLSMEKRVKVATQFLHSKITVNINIPVVVWWGPDGGRHVIQRSKPGEYPRVDLTPLRNTLLQDGPKEVEPGVWEGYVGTPLDYGVILETHEPMKRKYMIRTLNENRTQIEGILSGPLEIV